MNLNLIHLISTVVTTVLFPLLVWGIQKMTQLIRQFNVLETQFDDVHRDVASLKEASRIADQKLVLLEGAIAEIAALRESTTEQFSEIKSDLRQLPRMLTLLEHNTAAIAVIVPRSEVETRIKSAEDRIKLVEQDIRNSRHH